MKIFPGSDLRTLSNSGSAVFKYVENLFHEWINSTPPGHEYREMYFGEDAIYEKKGAIVQVIEEALYEANDTGKPVELATFDYEGVFQG